MPGTKPTTIAFESSLSAASERVRLAIAAFVAVYGVASPR